MQLKKRLRINVAVSVLTAFVICLVLFLALYRLNNANNLGRIAGDTIAGTLERVSLRNDYMRNNSARAKEQWFARQERLRVLIKSASENFRDAEDRKNIAGLIEDHNASGEIFSAIVANREKSVLKPESAGLSREVEDRLLNQLNMRVYEETMHGRKMLESARKARNSALSLVAGGVVSALVILITVAMINAWTMGRAITARAARLREGAEVIGSGDLKHRIDVKGDDEFAEIAEAFNAMTARLSGSYHDLENQVNERKQAEEAIARRNSLLMGINDIFKEALTCRTEEELAEACLKIAQELTGSRFGFIGEIGPDGLLHDIAISEPGWDACAMYDRTGKRRMPGSFHIHGIYGSVLTDGKSFFTNDPASHPDSIGLPEGHPRLAAFLGVPMRSGGKTIGMIAMGNRDGGYREEDLEALEALAPAIVEAFQRKRAELALTKRTIELEAANRELEAFAYSVSHDLRAPLRSINGFSQALQEDYSDKLDAEGKDSLERIVAATWRMGQLIDDLLNLSRMTRIEMIYGKVNLSENARKIAGKLKDAEPQRLVEFIIAEDLIVYGDERLLRVALENLLGNAWKFTEKQSRAEIEFGVSALDGRTAYFVRDNGAGFDMAYADKLFNPFQRLHSVSQFPGTGIGLATVKRIVNRHGGQVRAEGEVGKGATIYFTL
jgi:signal transduction histidine kinase